jgi:hypothetical protein
MTTTTTTLKQLSTTALFCSLCRLIFKLWMETRTHKIHNVSGLMSHSMWHIICLESNVSKKRKNHCVRRQGDIDDGEFLLHENEHMLRRRNGRSYCNGTTVEYPVLTTIQPNDCDVVAMNG